MFYLNLKDPILSCKSLWWRNSTNWISSNHIRCHRWQIFQNLNDIQEKSIFYKNLNPWYIHLCFGEMPVQVKKRIVEVYGDCMILFGGMKSWYWLKGVPVQSISFITLDKFLYPLFYMIDLISISRSFHHKARILEV